MDSPGSPLSEHSDDEFQDQETTYGRKYSGASPSPTELGSARPSKRQKIGPSSHRDRDSITHHNAPPAHSALGNFDVMPELAPDEVMSSDTDGSVPGSPHIAASVLPGDEDDGFHKGEQVSFCRWEGCPAGELGNMDLLVQHLHDEHIHARQKKYACEWADCTRKGIPHASGYALRAHMRSHTREKPFYCTLPECDRSFTRSDALAKHMRTVHETEALRPSDPVPKHHSSNPQNKNQKLRLTFKAIGANGSSNGNGGPGSDAGKSSAPASPLTTAPWQTFWKTDEDYDNANVVYVPVGTRGEVVKQFPPDVQFTDEELALDAADLYRVLKHQLEWASEEQEELKRELLDLEEKRAKEWTAKELAFENLMEAEAERAARKPLQSGEDPEYTLMIQEEVRDTRKMKLHGNPPTTPWWRLPARNKELGGSGVMEGIERTNGAAVAV